MPNAKLIGTLSTSRNAHGMNQDVYATGPEIVQGPDNLDNIRFLDNSEKFKTVLLNGYLQKMQSVGDVTRYEKQIKRSDIGAVLKNAQISEVPVRGLERGGAPSKSYDKHMFCPFAEERDHLGRIIDSVSSL